MCFACVGILVPPYQSISTNQPTNSFIEEHAALNKVPGRKEPPQPFFLYVAMAHMHVPLAYDPQFENASPRTGDQRIYGNTLAEGESISGGWWVDGVGLGLRLRLI